MIILRDAPSKNTLLKAVLSRALIVKHFVTTTKTKSVVSVCIE